MQNHTVILGWTDRTILIVKELCIAQSSEGGSVIAIMDEMEKASGPHACADPRACPERPAALPALPHAGPEGGEGEIRFWLNPGPHSCPRPLSPPRP